MKQITYMWDFIILIGKNKIYNLAEMYVCVCVDIYKSLSDLLQ